MEKILRETRKLFTGICTVTMSQERKQIQNKSKERDELGLSLEGQFGC